MMFDALEQKFANTGQGDLINQLYQGKMKDYVKCLGCGYESAREDSYLDIPLVIKPFGSDRAYGSVVSRVVVLFVFLCMCLLTILPFCFVSFHRLPVCCCYCLGGSSN